MPAKCCVRECENTRKDAALHTFPVKNKVELKKWLECLEGHVHRISGRSLKELSKLWVCNLHYEKCFISKTKIRTRLISGAYPSLFSPEEFASGLPARGFEDKENNPVAPRDHSYSRKQHEDHTYCSALTSGVQNIVTEKSVHHTFWKEAIIELENIRYIDSNGRKVTVPSIKNFITTLKSMMRLWQFFKTKDLKIMRPRYFNSDIIENFFGQVRAYNYRNNDPSCHTFKCTFKSLLITRVIQFHSDSYNCQGDAADPIVNLQTLFEPAQLAGQRHSEQNVDFSSILHDARKERLAQHSQAYTVGWVVRKVLKQFKCSQGKNDFVSKEILPIHQWITSREFNIINKRSLTYPAEWAVKSFGEVLNTTNDFLEKQGHKNNLLQQIMSSIKESGKSLDFIQCQLHKPAIEEYFLTITIRFGIKNWCNIINKILKGTDIQRLANVQIPKMQEKALSKYNKKLKNKKTNENDT